MILTMLYKFTLHNGSYACKIDALDQWCLGMLPGIKWYQFVRNDDVWRLTKQPKLTAIIQSHWLTLFGHVMCMDDNADAKRILLASPPADWRRQLGRPRITWLNRIQQDLKQHHLTFPEAADDPVILPSGRLEKTTRSSPHHVAQHRPTGSETTPPYAPRSSRFGSEPPSVEYDVNVWCYAIVRIACQKRRRRRYLFTVHSL